MDFDLFSWLNKRHEQATASLHPTQKEITYGTKVVTFSATGLIFGAIFTTDEVLDSERAEGATTKEAAYTLAVTKEAQDDGRVYGRFYSVEEPDGEVGSNHKFNLWPISEDVFSEAQQARWNPHLLDQQVWDELDLALNSFNHHLIQVGGIDIWPDTGSGHG